MTKKRVDQAYKKIKVGFSIERWVHAYLQNNVDNMSELVNKLLKEYIKKDKDLK